MSIKIMTQIWEYQNVKGTSKLALLALADHANDNGYCYPAYETLALKVGVGRRQVINIIEALVQQGDVWVIPKAGHRNRYVIVAGQSEDEIYSRLLNSGDIEKSAIEAAVKLILSRQRGEPDCTGATYCTGEMQYQRGEAHFTGGVKPISPKPSVNRQKEPSTAAETSPPILPPPSTALATLSEAVAVKPKKPRPRDELHDVIAELWGVPGGMAAKLKKQMLGKYREGQGLYAYNFDTPVTAAEVRAFVGWYRSKYRELELPLTPEKLQAHFYRFRTSEQVASKPAIRVVNGVTQEKIGGTWYTKRTDPPTGAI